MKFDLAIFESFGDWYFVAQFISSNWLSYGKFPGNSRIDHLLQFSSSSTPVNANRDENESHNEEYKYNHRHCKVKLTSGACSRTSILIVGAFMALDVAASGGTIFMETTCLTHIESAIGEVALFIEGALSIDCTALPRSVALFIGST